MPEYRHFLALLKDKVWKGSLFLGFNLEKNSVGGIQYAIFWKKMADTSQLIISLTLLLGNHAPKMTTKEKSKLKKISLKKLNQHINLFHFSADIGQVHHMFSRFLNLRFFSQHFLYFVFLKMAFFQRGLMRLWFLQADKPNYFPELEFWISFHSKWLKSCQIRKWSCSECSKKAL